MLVTCHINLSAIIFGDIWNIPDGNIILENLSFNENQFKFKYGISLQVHGLDIEEGDLVASWKKKQNKMKLLIW